MASKVVEAIKAALEQRGEVRPQGKGWRTRCPNPGHDDVHPSFFVYPGGGGRCFSQCNHYWPPQELAELLGITLPEEKPGLTLAQLAEAKGLPETFLRSLGVSDGVAGSGNSRIPCVDVPYVDQRGEIVAVRKRLSLEGNPRFVWRRGDHTTLYGLAYLRDIRKAGFAILVEGESDCWTLWYHRIPALALPGASTWRHEYAALLSGLVVCVWHEPDGGGDGLVKAISGDIPEVRIIEAPPGAKDPSELYLQDAEHFKEKMEALTKAARPLSELRGHALDVKAQEAFEAAQSLLNDPNILSRLKEMVGNAGYAGDARPALIAYVAITSRLLERPLNLAYVSLSAAGKNAAVDVVLPLFPEGACYLVNASSPRVLVYNDEVFMHRTVIFREADSLPEDGPAASAMRSLMSDGEMTYEVVEKGDDGRFTARRIRKPGPTGLITTSVKPLGDQASTRMLTVSISDTPEQTRKVLHAQAARSNQALPAQDLSPWVALQQWLALAGERRVVVPFADALADLVPANTVRMRRDFAQLLTVIKAIAFLQQSQRERDADSRIIATLDDYGQARWLLEDVFTTTISEGLTPAVRETVEAVSRLASDENPVSEKQLAEALRLAKSTIHYRVQRALQGGWLVNQATERGALARLIVGVSLPDGCPLPEASALGVCVENPENDSNPRTAPNAPATAQIGADSSRGIRTRFEPGSNPCSNPTPSCPDRRFERFEPLGDGGTHTQRENPGPCFVCCKTSWWWRPDGTGPVCGNCHPNPTLSIPEDDAVEF